MILIAISSPLFADSGILADDDHHDYHHQDDNDDDDDDGHDSDELPDKGDSGILAQRRVLCQPIMAKLYAMLQSI